LGTALAVRISLARRPWLALCLGPILVLAFGAKYAALLFIPCVLATLALSMLLRSGWLAMLVRTGMALFSLVVAGTLAALGVIHFDPNMLHALAATTTDRVVLQAYSRAGLFEHVVQMAGLPYAIGLVALAFARKKQTLIVLLFLGASLLVPAYHIYKAELISLDKHLGFSMFFVMPAAGYALASLSGFRRIASPGRYWLSGVAICLVLFLIGTREALDMYAIWPPTDQLAYVFNTQVRPGGGHYLAEQFESSRYNLRNDTYTWQWTGLDFFEYKDKLGRYYAGNDAYVKAVDDGYFDLIQLNYGYNLQTSLLIARAIQQSKKYELIDKIPYRDYYGTGFYWIWRKR
jgi:hypothetical protein